MSTETIGEIDQPEGLVIQLVVPDEKPPQKPNWGGRHIVIAIVGFTVGCIATAAIVYNIATQFFELFFEGFIQGVFELLRMGPWRHWI